MNYEEALAYIKECTKFGIKLGLERINVMLKRLGDPQKQFQAIHIAGTNGKGSTSAMFNAVLREAGYRIGRYTSPHLISYRERFVVDDVMITKEQLVTTMDEMKPVIDSVKADGYGAPTEFEVGTALAFLFFAHQKVDVALVEVGMGGRFDATNVLQPILSVITHIALDHQEYLGDTLLEIAFEKAGIIKKGIPAVIGVQEAEVAAYLAKTAEERGAPAGLAEREAVSEIVICDTGTRFRVNSPFYGELEIRIPLLGRHQVDNCLNVIRGVEMLRQSGYVIAPETFLAGLAKATWPGRVERMPQITTTRFYFDGAHNPDGARALVDTIKTIYPGEKADLLVGILNNRPLDEMAAILAEIARRVIVTTVPDPKSAAAVDLAMAFSNVQIPVIVEPDPKQALQLLLETDHSLAVATGSLYLTGWLRGIILQTGE